MTSQIFHGEPVASQTDAELVVLARRIITGELLVADLADNDWRMSLMLMLSAMKPETSPPNIGLILVPLAPHAHGHWLNGRVPGCTFSIEMVAEEDLDRFNSFYGPMVAALYPAVPDA